MKHTMYKFTTKDGKTFYAGGNNRFDAQMNIELAYQISLAGATYEEIYKQRTVRTGTVQ